MSTLLTDPPAPAPAPTPAPVAPAPAPAPAPNGDGRWAVPEDHRGDYLKNFLDDKGTVDPLAILKSFGNAQQLIGRDKIPMPKSEEEWANAYKMLGRPDDATGYKLEFLSKLPEGTPRNEARETAFRGLALKIGLNEQQAEAVAQFGLANLTEDATSLKTAGDTARATAEAALKREWGNGYEGMVAVAKVAWQEYGSPELAQHLEQSGLGNDPRLIKAFATIGKELMGDDKLKGSLNGRVTETPGDLDKSIMEYRSKHNLALVDRYHPEHELRVREMSSLFQRRYPEQQQGMMG